MDKSQEHTKDQADVVADHILRWNLVTIVLIFIAQCVGTWFFKDDAALVAMVNSMATLIIKGLIDDRRDVNGFYFGSSLGSKMKENRKDK